MAFNRIQTSVHGKLLGLTSSGGVAFQPTTSTGMSHVAEISSAGVVNSSISGFGSTITDMTVATFRSVVETISSSAATMLGYGLSWISSDVINVSVLTLSAPVAGVHKYIYGDSSASTVTFNTTAASITFGASVLSSALVFDNAGGIRGTGLILVGLSATRWAFFGRNATV